MNFKIKTDYVMKTKVQTLLQNGKVINHRGFVDAETWIVRKIDFLKNIYKFDDCDVERTGDVFTVRCHRDPGKPGTRGGRKDIIFVITLVN